MSKMKPVYISVDLEFTTGTDLLGGRVMQIGAAAQNGDTRNAILPVSTRAVTDDWVRENLKPLLNQCWDLDNFSSNRPPVHRGKSLVNADFFSKMEGLHEWVRRVQWKASNYGLGGQDKDRLNEAYPAVMVTWCGGNDFAYLHKAFSACGLESPFHHKMLDISGVAIGKLGWEWGFCSSDLAKFLGVPPNENKHDALADAQHQLHIFEALMAREVEVVFDLLPKDPGA